ncbi:MAG: hypothetical protein J0L92_36545, partial [Deltaproteobacteria bacterium]|nr:hypothetical protein [Deltaproteobacteria bacterium]
GGPALAGLVPSPEGLVAIFEGSAQELHRISIDMARADLDRDGLTAEEESALGTSDLSRDSDGDGFDDAVERSLATDPASATSLPPALPFEPNAVLAATSYLAMERPRGFDRSECILGRCWSTPGLADVACVREGAGPTRVCIDAADADAPMLEFYAVPSPTREHIFEPAEPVTASSHPSRLRWRVREVASGTTRDVSPPAGVEYMQDPLPVSGDEAFFTIIDQASGAPVSIARWREGSTSVVLARDACARFVGERECGIAIVGHDRARDRLIAAVWSSDGAQIERTWLFLLEGADARYVGEVTSTLPAGASVVALHSLDSGGYVVTLRLADGNAPATAVRLDPYFRPAGTQARVMSSGIAPGLGRFRRGYVATDLIGTLVTPPPSGNACIESRGAAVCFDTTGGGSSDPFFAPAIFPLEWQTVGDALAPGETVGFASRPLLTSYGLGFPADPTLFRVTREGAIAPWIDLARLRSLMDAPTRAALEATRLFVDETRPVRTVAVSPDLTRICLADGQRTLELALDRGRPSLVRLAAADAGEACAYDQDGRLAVIASAPHALRVEGTSYALPDGPISELVRVGQTWVLARAGERALCLGDTASAPEETPVRAVGIAPFLSGIVWLDGEGQGHFAPDAASFCSGAATDRLGPVGFDLWEQASLTSRIPGFLTVSDVALAVRGDGRVLASPRLGEAEDAFPLVLAVSWFPRWESVDGAGARVLDPFRWRYDGAYEGVEVERLSSVAALSYAPGPGPDDDWGYRGRLGMRAAPTAGADAGAADAGTSPTAPPTGCACRVAPIHRGGVAGLALVGLAILLSIESRRASRRRRGAAPR